MTAAAWLLTVVILRPVQAERHPSVEFPSLDTCWRKGLDVVGEEASHGAISGFRCATKTEPLP